MDHASFTTAVSIHGDRKATITNKSVALLDSGSPSLFVTDAVINEMLQEGTASSDTITVGKPCRWGGFTDSTETLKTNRSPCLRVQFHREQKPTAQMRLCCHIVPPMVLQHDLLLGRDSLLKFEHHTYAALPQQTGRAVVGELELRQENPQNVVTLIQPANTENDFHLRCVGEDPASLTPKSCRLKVTLIRSDNTQAMTGSYFVQMYDDWNLNEDEMVVREGKQAIPFSLRECSGIPSGALLGTSIGPMLPTTLKNTGPQELMGKGCVSTVTERSLLDKDPGEESDGKEKPSNTLGAHLPTPQRESVKKYG